MTPKPPSDGVATGSVHPHNPVSVTNQGSPSQIAAFVRAHESAVVLIGDRDLKIDDCDHIIHELLERATSVQLHFKASDLAWVREKLAGWGIDGSGDVQLQQHRQDSKTILELKHSPAQS